MVWKKWTVYAKKYYLEALKLKENECIPHFTGYYPVDSIYWVLLGAVF